MSTFERRNSVLDGAFARLSKEINRVFRAWETLKPIENVLKRTNITSQQVRESSPATTV